MSAPARPRPAPGPTCWASTAGSATTSPGCPTATPPSGVTRERWLTQLFSALGYGRVPPTGAGGLAVDDQAYPVSHLWGATPIHLLGWGVPLDRRTPGRARAQRNAPRTPWCKSCSTAPTRYLWAVLRNGRVLRLLRDSTSLTGQAYVEFDLEAMFDGELFADFALLYLLVHQSRVEVADGAAPTDCWLERWRTTAVSQGVRALDLLRDGVQQALEILGHRLPAAPRQHRPARPSGQRRRSGSTTCTRACCAPSTGCCSGPSPRTGERCSTRRGPDAGRPLPRHFSSARLRDLARRRHGTAHHDLWDGVTLVFDRPRPHRRRTATRPARPRWACSPPERADVLAGRRSSATSRCWPRSGRCRSSSPRASRGASSTSATSAPRSSARSTSHCSSWSPATTRSRQTFTPGGGGRQRPQDHAAATTPRPTWSSSSSTPPSTRCSTTPRSSPTPRRPCSP